MVQSFLAGIFLFGFFNTSIINTTTVPHQPSPDSLKSAFHLTYKLSAPDQVIEMPDELREISGLGYIAEKGQLVAVQDEKGSVFFIDKNSGEVLNKLKFRKEGDYEGIEFAGQDIYVIKSTGTVYEVNPDKAEEPLVGTYNGFLQKEHNVEGLCFDSKNNRLLLACKGTGSEEETLKKSIFSFSLNTKEVHTEPAFTISLDDVNNYLNLCPPSENTEKVQSCFKPDDKKLAFSPSGIAIHPIDGSIYMTSSVKKLLVILSQSGQILHMEKLSKKIHRQPEGLCFTNDGTLYICNEARGDEAAKIYRFDMK